MNQTPRIAIIGAGLAGLTAAYRLQQRGISCEIFEARERAGGRVLTYYDQSSYEELGGKSIQHGGEADNIKSLLFELGLKIAVHNYSDNRLYYCEGKVYDYYSFFQGAPPPTEKTYAALVSKAKSATNMLQLLQWFFSDHKELLQMYTLFLAVFEGSPAEDLGTYVVDLFWDYYKSAHKTAKQRKLNELENSTYEMIEGGSSTLVEALCSKLKGSIHYHAALQKLYRYSPNKIGLAFENQKEELFDKVILAIPCTTLRDIDIEPDLIAEDQLKAIQTLQYGTVGKILFPVRSEKIVTQVSFGPDFISLFNKDQTILALYCSGQAARFDVHDLYALEKSLQERLAILKVLYPTLEITGEPILISWALEKYSKGSYSNFGVGQFEHFHQKIKVLGEEVKKVFRPVEAQIFFAGEHTAFKHYATMEGAVESGNRTARMVSRSLA